MPSPIEPALRTAAASADSALLTALLAIIIVSGLCAPVMTRIVADYFKQLMRSHHQAQSGEKTLGERLVVIVGLLQTVVFGALLLFCALGAAERPPLASLAGLTLLTTLLLTGQLTGYRLVGYAFASTEESHSWLSAFLTTQALCGYLLVIPAFGALFYPSLTFAFAIAAGVVFVACRIPLFISEFRIFHTDNLSLIYFFLYLCTLEIVPLLAVWSLAGVFSSLFC